MSEKKEYIERGALIASVRGVRQRLPKDSKDFFTRDEMLLNFQQYIECQKAADVEPVVRCRDCKHGTAKCQNSIYCEMLHFYHREDFYCFYGAYMERSGSGDK